MIRVFIGFDAAETVAFHVLSHSIHRHATEPVSVSPVMLSQLGKVFTRERVPMQSTDFAFSRFLVPHLAGYEGWAIFMDCDMLVRADIAGLWAKRDERYAVQVVKHNHVPQEQTKFLGAVQTKYEKKNWSSVMLLNCGRCKALTPEFVNTATGLQLHQFKWLGDDNLIGEIPTAWNHLVGHDPYRDDAALVHFTVGGPWFKEYEGSDYAGEWFRERDLVLESQQRVRIAAEAGKK
ncbi:glycosyltransferase [Usitatibacter palustris]|nr:glycosyltransferase [Usitatibacter palustris]